MEAVNWQRYVEKDLAAKAEISSTSIAKLAKNENVNTEILRKICTALQCDISDIMEMLNEKNLVETEQTND